MAQRLGPPGDRKRPHLHVDAVQGFGLGRLRPRALGADSVALSAHKLHGPRGAGALWLRPGARLAPLWVGGGQERGLRGGSENLPALVAFGVAATQARAAAQDGAEERVAALRDRFEQAALAALATLVPGVRPTVTGAPRAAHIASLAFPGFSGPELVAALDLEGVSVSAGPACSAGTMEPSKALTMLYGEDRARRTIRVSLGEETSAEEIDFALGVFREVLQRSART